MPAVAHFQKAVSEFARADFPKLRADMSIAGAFETIRGHELGERIIYFYVVDDADRLVGVLPTRRMLASPLETKLSDIMIRRVVAVPITATLLDACDLFVLYKFYALPVVDAERRIVGILDMSTFTEGLLDLAAQEPSDVVFETLGFHVSQFRGASPWRAFRLRFPWLLATVGCGTLAAFVAGLFEPVLHRAVVIACFLALVLALADAVSIQSMALAIQALRSERPTPAWFLRTAWREVGSGLLLGIASGAIVFLITWFWRGQATAAAVIGISIAGAGIVAAATGLTVPSMLHALKLDPKIAAGPITLAIADLLTLLLYLSLAKVLL